MIYNESINKTAIEIRAWMSVDTIIKLNAMPV